MWEMKHDTRYWIAFNMSTYYSSVCKAEKNEAYQRQETSDSFSSSSTYSTQGRRELEPVHQLSSVLFIQWEIHNNSCLKVLYMVKTQQYSKGLTLRNR